MNRSVRNKLSVMMFLEFFIWGAWLPLIFGYLPTLGFTSTEQAWIINAFALASFTAMFFSTQFADRNFAAERFMAFSHLVGGVAILALFWVRRPGPDESASFWVFFLLMLVHSLFYVPTISIANSIAFASLKDAQQDFGPVRLWGTIGWIAASVPFTFLLADKKGVAFDEGVAYTFVVSGIASLLLAGFSLWLPHTPAKPASATSQRFAWLEAMKLLRVPFVLVLFVVTFFDSTVHACYFFWTGRFLQSIGIPGNWVMPVMAVGQIAEIGTMAVLGVFLKRLGWRTTMVLGILGHTVRFGAFAMLPDPWVAVVVNLLHGVCYAFFFATVYIFVDEYFPKDARSSAQGLFNFLILGLGPFVGNFIWAELGNVFTTLDLSTRLFPLSAATAAVTAPTLDLPITGNILLPSLAADQVHFDKLFLVPSAIASLAALLLLLFFHPPRNVEPVPEEVPVAVEGAEQFQARP